MKVLLVVFAIIGVTYGTVAGGFEAISNHMPKALMRAAVEISNEGDAETQSLVREIQTPAFQAYITNIK